MRSYFFKKAKTRLYVDNSTDYKVSTISRLLAVKKRKKKSKDKIERFQREAMESNIKNFYNEYNSLLKQNKSIKKLHKYACMIKINFKFITPYISRDDNDFYFIDNPVSKEKVLDIPVIHASTWKGNLHWASLKNYVTTNQLDTFEFSGDKDDLFEERLRLIKLFGTEHSSVSRYLDALYYDAGYETDNVFGEYIEDEYENSHPDKILERRGRLTFYSSYFKNITYEVINPHDRITRSSKNGPIEIEAIDKSKGELNILYFPFDLIGKDYSEVKEEINKDLEMTLNGVIALLETYGMSAKRKAGYGQATITGISLDTKIKDIDGIKLNSDFEYSIATDRGEDKDETKSNR